MKLNEIDTYENQTILNGYIYSRYLCVHNDEFARSRNEFQLKETINESSLKRNDVKFAIEIVSYDKSGNINVFLLTTITDVENPIYLFGCEENEWKTDNDIVLQLENLYYTVVPNNFNLIK